MEIPKIHRMNITFPLNRKKLYIFINFPHICNIIVCDVQTGLYISTYCLFVVKIVKNSLNSIRSVACPCFCMMRIYFLGV